MKVQLFILLESLSNPLGLNDILILLEGRFFKAASQQLAMSYRTQSISVSRPKVVPLTGKEKKSRTIIDELGIFEI